MAYVLSSNDWRMESGRPDHRGTTWGADWWLGRDVTMANLKGRFTVTSVEDGYLVFNAGQYRMPMDEANLRMVRGELNA
jgi:hypothetical protein